MLEALIEIVRRAGDMVLSAHDIQNVTREKHGPADLVTQYDEAVQRAVLAAKTFPALLSGMKFSDVRVMTLKFRPR